MPLPVEIIGNMFSGVNYVHTASIFDILLSIPLIFFGMNDQTFGILNYSPILGVLILPFLRAVRKPSIYNLSEFEKFLIIFAVLLFVVYLPFISSGIVKTGVRDYRFYIPLFIPSFTSFPKKLLKSIVRGSGRILSLFYRSTL